MKRTLLALFISLSLLLGFTVNTYAAAAPVIVTAGDPEAILEIARECGDADLTTDKEGDPKITGRIKGGGVYILNFFGCKENKNCKTIQFVTYWEGYKVSPEDVAKWSWESGMFAKARLDGDNDPWLKMRLNLDEGVTRGNLLDNFAWWFVLTESFEKEVLKIKK